MKRFILIGRIGFFLDRNLRMFSQKIRIIESDIPDNARAIGDDAEFVDITEMTVNVELFDFRIGFGVCGH